MPYALLKDEVYDHPKFVGLSDPAMALWTRGLSWSMRHLTDGKITLPAVRMLVGGSAAKARKVCDELVTAGLFEIDGDDYRYHDFLAHNPSGEKVREKRQKVSEARSQAGKAGAAARWRNGKPGSKRDGKPVANAEATGKQTDDPVPVPVKHPPAPHGNTEVERPHEGAGGPAPEEEEGQNHHRLVDAAMAAAVAHELAAQEGDVRNVDRWTTAKLKAYEPRRTRALDLLNAGIEPDQLGDFFITGQAPSKRTGPPPTEHWTPEQRAAALAESADTRAAIRATLAARRNTTDPTEGDPPPMDPSTDPTPADPSVAS